MSSIGFMREYLLSYFAQLHREGLDIILQLLVFGELNFKKATVHRTLLIQMDFLLVLSSTTVICLHAVQPGSLDVITSYLWSFDLAF